MDSTLVQFVSSFVIFVSSRELFFSPNQGVNVTHQEQFPKAQELNQ